MGKKLTIVMYHFVRDLEHSRYPELKALRLQEFSEQLGYIKKHYNVVKMEDAIAAAHSGEDSLPSNPLLLTFDDGYLDHFISVFPLLDKMGFQGSFFPPAKAITQNQVLEVNKIHYVLASVPEKSRIIEFMFSMLEELRCRYALQTEEYYRKTVSTESRFDTKEVTFVKGMLQRELPEGARREIVDRLFTKYVTSDEAAFSRELYMTVDQLHCMKRNGMFIGSHGYAHYWLGTLDAIDQEREVDLSLTFLKEIGCDTDHWVMCYPYGSYNETLLTLLKRKGCKLGLSVHVDLADLRNANPLTLPRLDTNDLPKAHNVGANEWTLKAMD